MIKWQKIKLGDICDVVGGGTPSTKVDDYWNGSIPWLTPKDLSGYSNRYISRGERNITEEGLQNSSAKMLPKGTVLLTSRAPIGYVAIANNDVCTNQGFKSIVLNAGLYSSEFFYYLLKNNIDYIVGMASGSTFAEISGAQVKNLEFDVPPLEIQRKIAGILGALDDKIEVLREQNKTLEQMAQAVFQSWFVDFDIVRAKAANMPTEDICKKYRITPDICALFPSAFTPDHLPQGWEKKKLEDMGMIVGGGTPSTENKEFFAPAGSSVPWITPKDLSGYTGKFISYGSTDVSEKGLKESSAKLMPKGTVLFSSRAPIGYCVIAENDISTNQGFKSIVPNNSGYTEYLYQFLKNNIDMISGYSTGSTFKEVSGSTMKQIPILKPTDDILIKFEEIVRSLNQKNKENSKQIRTLEQTRDTLLPQLMNGKIKV